MSSSASTKNMRKATLLTTPYAIVLEKKLAYSQCYAGKMYLKNQHVRNKTAVYMQHMH